MLILLELLQESPFLQLFKELVAPNKTNSSVLFSMVGVADEHIHMKEDVEPAWKEDDTQVCSQAIRRMVGDGEEARQHSKEVLNASKAQRRCSQVSCKFPATGQ